jgi:hypothetical protein
LTDTFRSLGSKQHKNTDDLTVGASLLTSVLFVLQATVLGPIISFLATAGIAVLVATALSLERYIPPTNGVHSSDEADDGVLHNMLSLVCSRIGFALVDSIAVRQVWISDVNVAPPNTNNQLLPAPSIGTQASGAPHDNCIVQLGVSNLRTSLRKRRHFTVRSSRRTPSGDLREIMVEAQAEGAGREAKLVVTSSKTVCADNCSTFFL